MNDDDDRALDGGDGDDDNANDGDEDDYDEEDDDDNGHGEKRAQREIKGNLTLLLFRGRL